MPGENPFQFAHSHHKDNIITENQRERVTTRIESSRIQERETLSKHDGKIERDKPLHQEATSNQIQRRYIITIDSSLVTPFQVTDSGSRERAGGRGRVCQTHLWIRRAGDVVTPLAGRYLLRDFQFEYREGFEGFERYSNVLPVSSELYPVCCTMR